MKNISRVLYWKVLPWISLLPALAAHFGRLFLESLGIIEREEDEEEDY